MRCMIEKMIGVRLNKIAVSKFSIINELSRKQRSMNSLNIMEIQLQLKLYGIVEIIEKQEV